LSLKHSLALRNRFGQPIAHKPLSRDNLLCFRDGNELKKLSSIHQCSINYVGKSNVTRRTIVGTAGIGIAAAASPAFAKANSEMKAQELQNPAAKYPKPPYKKQSQPWPGLASQMDPRPDHGEKSYRGSGRLAGRKAPITGGDSGMGRAAAIAYAREGADVAINYFPTEEPDAKEVIELIKAEGRIGLAIPGDLRDENSVRNSSPARSRARVVSTLS
jgi:hypothetical protein